jgi:hypothetical protein
VHIEDAGGIGAEVDAPPAGVDGHDDFDGREMADPIGDGFVDSCSDDHDGVSDWHTFASDATDVDDLHHTPDAGPPPPQSLSAPRGPSMVVDTPYGQERIGPPTEDTNNDGRPDTTVVPTDTGTMLVTDIDGDGSADQIVEIDDTGEVTVSHHMGPGQWAVVEQGRLDQNGHYARDPASHVVGTDDSAWISDETTHTAPPPPPDVAADSDAVWV